MSLKVQIQNGSVVELKGEPWHFYSNVKYFPVQKVLLTGELAECYDHLSPTGINEDYYKSLFDIDYEAYCFDDHMSAVQALQFMHDFASHRAKVEVQFAIRKALGI